MSRVIMRRSTIFYWILVCNLLVLVRTNDSHLEVTFDGTQYIEKSMLVQPTHQRTNELNMIFRTSISSGLLFYASGVTGDYIVLELVHGKLR